MLLYLAFGAGLLWLLLWSQKSRPILKFPQWRIASGVLATCMFAAAGAMSLAGQWGKGLVLLVLGVWLAASARYPRRDKPAAPIAEPMSVGEAYSILDLKPGASREDVQAAYTRLMKLVHPDKGGGAGLAAKLNAARDRLLKD